MNNILKKGISGLLLLGALFMLPQGADARAAAGHYVRTNAAGKGSSTSTYMPITMRAATPGRSRPAWPTT